jgi:transketolase
MKHNPREEYGKILLELATKNRNIIALDADLCKSTMTCQIEANLPDQYVEMGIAEQNMLSTAAGLALAGKIPFANSFAIFLTSRAFDQIRQAICLSNLNVKIIGSSAGLSDFGDGSTHQTVEDVSIMRSIPNMTVIVPADGLQTREVIKAIVEYDGPVYVRTSRNDLEDVSSEADTFEIGKVYKLREGSDITIFAMGIMVKMALNVAEKLQIEGISVRVVNVPTLKPLDRQAIIDMAKDTGIAVTSEEHSIIGGLGSAVAEALRNERVILEFHGINDQYGQSSNEMQPLLDYYGLNEETLYKTVKTCLKLKAEK